MTFSLRRQLKPDDPQTVRAIVEDTGFFRPEEVTIAEELVTETLTKPGEYLFIFAEDGGRAVGYACQSEIPGTSGSYEIYWLAVLKEYQKRGVGRELLAAAEKDIKSCGGRQIYISTSGSELYVPTRKFYAKCGYGVATVLKDYYQPGDDQIIFWKST